MQRYKKNATHAMTIFCKPLSNPVKTAVLEGLSLRFLTQIEGFCGIIDQMFRNVSEKAKKKTL